MPMELVHTEVTPVVYHKKSSRSPSKSRAKSSRPRSVSPAPLPQPSVAPAMPVVTAQTLEPARIPSSYHSESAQPASVARPPSRLPTHEEEGSVCSNQDGNNVTQNQMISQQTNNIGGQTDTINVGGAPQYSNHHLAGGRRTRYTTGHHPYSTVRPSQKTMEMTRLPSSSRRRSAVASTAVLPTHYESGKNKSQVAVHQPREEPVCRLTSRVLIVLFIVLALTAIGVVGLVLGLS